MSAIKSNLIFFISIFPVWLIKFQFESVNYIIIILTLILLLIVHNLIIKNFKNKFDNLFTKFYYSVLIVYGIDNHLGLHSGLTLNYTEFWAKLLNASSFGIVYLASLFILIFLTLLSYIVIKLLRENGVYIFMINGTSIVNGIELNNRDGIGIRDENEIEIQITGPAEILLMEIPLAVNNN